MKLDENLCQEIVRLYLSGQSCNDIREYINTNYNISVCNAAILKQLKKRSFIRPRSDAIKLHFRNNEPISDILESYKDGLPVREIARKYNITRETIRKILSENGLKIRPSREALILSGHIREKEKFDLCTMERAYIFGLVYGDVTSRKKSNYTLKLITHTTHFTFAELLLASLRSYGTAKCTLNKRNEYRFSAYLDLNSFSFLLHSKTDPLPKWINDEVFLDFLAGFIDSDGSIIIRKSGQYFQFVIRVFGENIIVLNQIRQILENRGYDISIHRNHKKGEIRYSNNVMFRYNHDYYCLEVYKKHQTMKLLKLLGIRHPEKIAKKQLIFHIHEKRRVLWTDVEADVKELKRKIELLAKSRPSLC